MVKFAENGPTMTGPPRGIVANLTGTVLATGRAQVLGGRQAGEDQLPQKAAGRGGGRRVVAARGADAGRGRGADPTVAIIGGQVIASRAARWRRRRGGGGGRGGSLRLPISESPGTNIVGRET